MAEESMVNPPRIRMHAECHGSFRLIGVKSVWNKKSRGQRRRPPTPKLMRPFAAWWLAMVLAAAGLLSWMSAKASIHAGVLRDVKNP